MPVVNLFYRNREHEPQIVTAMDPLKNHIAEQLTCGDIILSPEEVSIRALCSLGEGMITDIEIDMTAAPFQERIDKQDEICLNVRSYAKEQMPDANDVKVWLNLHELGYGFE
jgi:hypothetical protein